MFQKCPDRSASAPAQQADTWRHTACSSVGLSLASFGRSVEHGCAPRGGFKLHGDRLADHDGNALGSDRTFIDQFLLSDFNDGIGVPI